MQGPGYRERLVATRSLNFAAYLSQIARNSDVIAADGQFVLFKTHGKL
jgi:16S rRNA G1207 methylase RsmC